MNVKRILKVLLIISLLVAGIGALYSTITQEPTPRLSSTAEPTEAVNPDRKGVLYHVTAVMYWESEIMDYTQGLSGFLSAGGTYGDYILLTYEDLEDAQAAYTAMLTAYNYALSFEPETDEGEAAMENLTVYVGSIMYFWETFTDYYGFEDHNSWASAMNLCQDTLKLARADLLGVMS